MNALLPVLFLSLSLASGGVASTEPCKGTYDRKGDCHAPDETLTKVVADQKGKNILESWGPGLDVQPLRAFFMGTGATLMGIATMSSVAWLATRTRVEDLARAEHSQESLRRAQLEEVQILALASGVLWATAALTTSAGLAFWIFNPKDGSLTLPGSHDHE